MNDSNKSFSLALAIGILFTFAFSFTRYLFSAPAPYPSLHWTPVVLFYIFIGFSVGLLAHRGKRISCSVYLFTLGFLASFPRILGALFFLPIFLLGVCVLYFSGLFLGVRVSRAYFSDAFPVKASKVVFFTLFSIVLLEFASLMVFKDLFVILTRTTALERATDRTRPPYFYLSAGEKVKALVAIARKDKAAQDLAHARKMLDKALKLAMSVGEPEKGNTYPTVRQGLICEVLSGQMEAGLLPEAQSAAEAAISDPEQRARDLSSCYRNTGYFEEALREAQKISDPRTKLYFIKDIGGYQAEKNKLEEAKQTAALVLQMKGSLGGEMDKEVYHFAYHLLAQAGYYEDAFKIGALLGESGQVDVINAIASYASKRNPDRAVKFWDRAVQQTLSVKDNVIRANRLDNICSQMAEGKLCAKARATAELIDIPMTKESAISSINIRCGPPK